jgi:hypothetical protein
MTDPALPIQPVENPILCSPYTEPDQHWLYDTLTGLPLKIPERRRASYWYKTERTGTAQGTRFAQEESDDLPLVNVLREDVRRWRQSGWESASEATKKVLVPIGITDWVASAANCWGSGGGLAGGYGVGTGMPFCQVFAHCHPC